MFFQSCKLCMFSVFWVRRLHDADGHDEYHSMFCCMIFGVSSAHGPFILFCSTVRYIYVIARTPESTRKLPPRDLQDTVHIVYFYVVKVRSGIYRQFCSKKSTIQLTYHSTVAFSWRVASPPHRPSPTKLFSPPPPPSPSQKYNNNRTRTPPSIPSTMPQTPRNPTTGRFRRSGSSTNRSGFRRCVWWGRPR